ncbi:MAG: cysteine hydrolase [Acidimicrobiales bacterium]
MANPRGDNSDGALLLIDFQDDFLSDNGRMPVARNQVGRVIAAANAAIEQSQAAGDLILKVGNEFRPRDVVGNALRHHAAIAGSPGTKWDPRLDVVDATYLVKWKGDAFCNPELRRVLEENGVERITLAGLYARACITATAKGAMKRGLKVRLLVDAIACRSDASRDAAVTRMRKRGVQPVRTDG